MGALLSCPFSLTLAIFLAFLFICCCFETGSHWISKFHGPGSNFLSCLWVLVRLQHSDPEHSALWIFIIKRLLLTFYQEYVVLKDIIHHFEAVSLQSLLMSPFSFIYFLNCFILFLLSRWGTEVYFIRATYNLKITRRSWRIACDRKIENTLKLLFTEVEHLRFSITY